MCHFISNITVDEFDPPLAAEAQAKKRGGLTEWVSGAFILNLMHFVFLLQFPTMCKNIANCSSLAELHPKFISVGPPSA